MLKYNLKLLVICLITLVINLNYCILANTYYVSNSIGNDDYNGLSIEHPFKSIEKINSLYFNPGDTILLKSGDIWEGMLWIKGSGSVQNPIILDSYGGEIKPAINGNGYQSCILIYNDDNININNLELFNEASHLDSLGNVKKLIGFGGASNSWGSGKDVRFGIKIIADNQSLSNFKLDELYIHDIYPTPENINNTHKGYGLKLETQSDTLINLYNTISNFEITNSSIYRTGHYGFWIKSLGLNMNFDDFKNDNIKVLDCLFEHTGGSGFVPNKSSNILVENCIFNHSGSSLDQRMWKRGSGMWPFDCYNVIAQQNYFMNARGPLDSYGSHIDYGNENVVFQYNFSINNEGGFVEILGDNINCGYRYNISVNDGYRLDPNNQLWRKRGKTFFVSNYCGSNTVRCPNSGTFIYNNTSFVNDTLSPEIYCWPNVGDVHIFNNIVFATSNGDVIPTLIENDSNTIDISHNIFYDVNRFYLDEDLWNSAIYEDPELINSDPLGSDDPTYYNVSNGSIAINQGRLVNGSDELTDYLENNGGRDFFGNIVSSDTPTTIGACNYNETNEFDLSNIIESSVVTYPNPTSTEINIELGLLSSENYLVSIFDSKGYKVYSIEDSKSSLKIDVSHLSKGVYHVLIKNKRNYINKKVVIK